MGLLDDIRGLLTPKPAVVPDPFDRQANAAIPIMGASEILPNMVGRMTGSPMAEFAAGFLSPSSWIKQPKKLDIFVGKGAKTADIPKLEKAQDMAKAGSPRDAIWKETGWWQGPDKQWRFEIADDAASYNSLEYAPSANEYADVIKANEIVASIQQGLAQHKSSGGKMGDFFDARPGLYEEYWKAKKIAQNYDSRINAPKSGIVGDVLRHDELFNAYGVKDIPIRYGDYEASAYLPNVSGGRLGFEPSPQRVQAEHATSGPQKRNVRTSLAADDTTPTPNEGVTRSTRHNASFQGLEPPTSNLASGHNTPVPSIAGSIQITNGFGQTRGKSVLLHELQHAIQQREGFARGGSPEAMRSFLAPDTSLQSAYSQAELYDAYHRLAGEAEARLTQARMPMTMDERLTIPPWTMFDVPESQQIVRFGDGPAMSTGRPRNHLGQEIPPTPYELAHAEAQRVAALPVEQGGLGLPEGNTAMDRARAMGHVPKEFYHATSSDVPKFDLSYAGQGTTISPLEKAAFLSDKPSVANEFVAGPYYKSGDEIARHYGEGSNIMPLSVRSDAPEVWDMYGGGYTSEFMEKTLKRAKKGGKDVVMFSNMKDPGFTTLGSGEVSNILAVLEPKNIRSRFAAFNPAKRDSADLLAGIAPWAMPIGATLLGGSFLLPPEEY